MNRKTELKQILFPTDFSESSLRAGDIASGIAKAFNANITLVHIIETSVYKSVFPEIDIDLFSESNISKAVENKLAQYSEELSGGTSIKVEPLFQVGTVSDLVFEAIGSTGAELIVTGLHGVKGLQKFFAGSNAYKIATRSAVPVISVPAEARPQIRTILLPIVEELTTLEKTPWAQLLALNLNATVKVLGLVNTDDSEQMETVKGNVHTAMNYLSEHGVRTEVFYEQKENYAETVLEYSSKMHADLVCIMSDRKKNTTGIFPGGYANQILNQSRISVFTMHPEII